MIYGMYVSAAGVMTNSYRQDIHANNIANAETVGFKRDVATFKERMTEATAMRAGIGQSAMGGKTNDLLEDLGGGILAFPTFTDKSQGEIEETGNPFDVAIQGKGFLAVKDGEDTLLTRDGRMMLNRKGELILAGSGHPVLDDKSRPIKLDASKIGTTSIAAKGEITQGGQLVATVGLFDPANPAALTKRGANLLNPGDGNALLPSTGQLRAGFTERSNVDPTTELTQLMDAQRQLEANASMIRYQDQSLGRLVSEVGKIG